LPVQDQRGHSILTDFLRRLDFRSHAPSSFERGGDAGSFFDLFGNIRDQRDQRGRGVPAWVLGEQAIDIGQDDQKVRVD